MSNFQAITLVSDEPFVKAPEESYPIAIDWSKEIAKLPGTAPTLDSATCTATRRGLNATSEILASSTCTVLGGLAIARIQGGERGAEYELKFVGEFSDTSTLAETVIVLVR